MFRAILAHLQEGLLKRQLVYCVRVMSVEHLLKMSKYCSKLVEALNS
jgi:hypothetical protein